MSEVAHQRQHQALVCTGRTHSLRASVAQCSDERAMGTSGFALLRLRPGDKAPASSPQNPGRMSRRRNPKRRPPASFGDGTRARPAGCVCEVARWATRSLTWRGSSSDAAIPAIILSAATTPARHPACPAGASSVPTAPPNMCGAAPKLRPAKGRRDASRWYGKQAKPAI